MLVYSGAIDNFRFIPTFSDSVYRNIVCSFSSSFLRRRNFLLVLAILFWIINHNSMTVTRNQFTFAIYYDYELKWIHIDQNSTIKRQLTKVNQQTIAHDVGILSSNNGFHMAQFHKI